MQVTAAFRLFYSLNISFGQLQAITRAACVDVSTLTSSTGMTRFETHVHPPVPPSPRGNGIFVYPLTGTLPRPVADDRSPPAIYRFAGNIDTETGLFFLFRCPARVGTVFGFLGPLDYGPVNSDPPCLSIIYGVHQMPNC